MAKKMPAAVAAGDDPEVFVEDEIKSRQDINGVSSR